MRMCVGKRIRIRMPCACTYGVCLPGQKADGGGAVE